MIFNYSKCSFLKEHENEESYVTGASYCHVLMPIREVWIDSWIY